MSSPFLCVSKIGFGMQEELFKIVDQRLQVQGQGIQMVSL